MTDPEADRAFDTAAAAAMERGELSEAELDRLTDMLARGEANLIDLRVRLTPTFNPSSALLLAPSERQLLLERLGAAELLSLRCTCFAMSVYVREELQFRFNRRARSLRAPLRASLLRHVQRWAADGANARPRRARASDQGEEAASPAAAPVPAPPSHSSAELRLFPPVPQKLALLYAAVVERPLGVVAAALQDALNSRGHLALPKPLVLMPLVFCPEHTLAQRGAMLRTFLEVASIAEALRLDPDWSCPVLEGQALEAEAQAMLRGVHLIEADHTLTVLDMSIWPHVDAVARAGAWPPPHEEPHMWADDEEAARMEATITHSVSRAPRTRERRVEEADKRRFWTLIVALAQQLAAALRHALIVRVARKEAAVAFKAGAHADACALYSVGISLRPIDDELWSNRALCHLKMGRTVNSRNEATTESAVCKGATLACCEDAQSALHRNAGNVKAAHHLAKAAVAVGHIEDVEFVQDALKDVVSEGNRFLEPMISEVQALRQTRNIDRASELRRAKEWERAMHSSCCEHEVVAACYAFCWVQGRHEQSRITKHALALGASRGSIECLINFVQLMEQELLEPNVFIDTLRSLVTEPVLLNDAAKVVDKLATMLHDEAERVSGVDLSRASVLMCEASLCKCVAWLCTRDSIQETELEAASHRLIDLAERAKKLIGGRRWKLTQDQHWWQYLFTFSGKESIKQRMMQIIKEECHMETYTGADGIERTDFRRIPRE